jgi:hypothetical protein
VSLIVVGGLVALTDLTKLLIAAAIEADTSLQYLLGTLLCHKRL